MKSNTRTVQRTAHRRSHHPPRVPHDEQAISGHEAAQDYHEKHRRSAGMVFKGLMRDVRAMKPRGRYMEMGCGPGLLSTMIAQDNPEVNITAVDLSPAMVALGREYARECGVQDRVRFVAADVLDEKTLTPEGRYDLIFSTFSLHHWQAPEKALAALWRALDDRGVLYIQDLKRVGWMYHLPFKNGFFESLRAAYTAEEIEAMFLTLGIHHYKIRNVFPWFMQAAIAWKWDENSD